MRRTATPQFSEFQLAGVRPVAVLFVAAIGPLILDPARPDSITNPLLLAAALPAGLPSSPTRRRAGPPSRPALSFVRSCNAVLPVAVNPFVR